MVLNQLYILRPLPNISAKSKSLGTEVIVMNDKKLIGKNQQWLGSLWLSSQHKAWVVLCSLILLLSLNACRQQPSKRQVDEVRNELTTVLDVLYVPKDAVQLAESITHGNNPILKNCIVIVTADIVYESPHDFEDVLDDYRESLADAGWVSSPYYRHDQMDVDFFHLEPNTTLTISSTPLNSEVVLDESSAVAPNQTLYKYFIQVSVSSPSTSDCRAG